MQRSAGATHQEDKNVKNNCAHHTYFVCQSSAAMSLLHDDVYARLYNTCQPHIHVHTLVNDHPPIKPLLTLPDVKTHPSSFTHSARQEPIYQLHVICFMAQM